MQEVVDFILEVDRLKAITRKIRVRGTDRYENSAEHSWQLAMLAQALAPYAEAPVDLNRVVRILLVHDLGEIETGDTIAFVEEGLAERKAAELACVQRIFGLLAEPQRSEFLALWQEFEDAQTAEARFAHSVDRAMPVILNLNNNGQSWRENGITYERVVRRVRAQIEQGSPALWQYLAARLARARDDGWFGMA
ncbi:MAG: HD domain-containing protein [Acidobacteriota bacterium]|nr:HD domain-containing protein [Acidobacteriota bacterium]